MRQLTFVIMMTVVVCMASSAYSVINVASGKVATADSEYGSSYNAGKAVDGDDTATSRWLSSTTTPHWWRVDLVGVYNITSIQVVAQSGYEDRLEGAALTVYQTADATGDWGYSNTVSLSGSEQTFSIPDGVTAGAIKLSGASDGSGFMGFTELRAYGTPCINLASGKVAHADSLYSSYYARYAVDNSTSTKWVSSTTPPHWWKVDLNGMYDVEIVQVQAQSGYADRLNGAILTVYQTSDATGDWTYSNTVSVSDGKLIDTFIMPDDLTAGSIKLSGAADGGGLMECVELRMYGASWTNIAAGKFAQSDSRYSNSYYASNAVDDNTSTKWVSSTTPPHWWKVNLSNVYLIDIVQVQVQSGFEDRLNGAALMLYHSLDATGPCIYSNTISLSSDKSSDSFTMPNGVTAGSIKVSGAADGSGLMECVELRVYKRPPAGTLIIIN